MDALHTKSWHLPNPVSLVHSTTRPVTPLLVLALCLALTGCRGNVELLEIRLREQEDLLHRTQADLSQVRNQLTASRELSARLQKQLAETSRGALVPEQAQALFRVQGIHIHKRLTAAMPSESATQPVTLNLVFFPHDSDMQPVKVPGQVTVHWVSADDPFGAEPLGEWKFTTEEVREHWHQGIIGSGFQFQLPCDQLTEIGQGLLRIQYQTIDGRDFSAEHRITLQPPGDTAQASNDAGN